MGKWEKPLIKNERLTLPEMLKEKGYQTGAIGKWHLGWNWPTHDSLAAKKENGNNVDYSMLITGGPIEHGFDYYFGDDVPNFPPYTFIENDKVTIKPTIIKPESLFGDNGIMAAGWKLEDVMPAITKKAVSYINEKSLSGKPFFLYFPLTAPHTPIAPAEEFKGKSKAGLYGDYVSEVDWVVGQIIKAQSDKKYVCIGSTDLTHYGPKYGFTPEGAGLSGIEWAKEANDKSFIDLAKHSGKDSDTVPKKTGIFGFMDIGSNHGAVDSNLFPFFNPFILTIGHQHAVDGLPCLRSYGFNIVAQGRLLESFISNANTTEPTITDRVEKMESQLLVTVAFHLFDDCSPEDLLCTHPFGPGISAHHVAGKILQNPFVNDRIGIKNLADAFQLLGVGVIYACYGKRHLFLVVFAHFRVTPFSVFAVILIVCTFFITTFRRICLP